MDLTMVLAQLSALDPNIVKAAAAVLAALAAFSLIKRAVKLGIFIAVLAAGAGMLLPLAEKYAISIENDQLVMVIDGQEIRLGGQDAAVKGMSLDQNADGDYILTVTYRDPVRTASIPIPAFMRGVVGEYIKRQDYGAPQASSEDDAGG